MKCSCGLTGFLVQLGVVVPLAAAALLRRPARATSLAESPGSSALALISLKSLGKDDVQPKDIALRLAAIEADWDTQAQVYLRCQLHWSEECNRLPMLFQNTCESVAASLAERAGNKTTVGPFMEDVCNQRFLNGWHRDQCNSLAEVVVATADLGLNQINGTLCGNLWSQLVVQEKENIHYTEESLQLNDQDLELLKADIRSQVKEDLRGELKEEVEQDVKKELKDELKAELEQEMRPSDGMRG